MKNENNTLLVVGGVVAAFAAYEFFIKPKNTPVSTVKPVGTGTTMVTQSTLPVASNVSPLTSLSQSIAKLLNPGTPAKTPASQPTAAQTAAQAADAQSLDNYFWNASDDGDGSSAPIKTPPIMYADNNTDPYNNVMDAGNVSSDELENIYYGDLGAVDRNPRYYFEG